MIIAFMGSGGSGKTTLCKLLSRRLKAFGYSVMYRKEFDYFIVKYAFSMIRKSSEIRNYVLETNFTRLYKIWLILVLIDNLIGYLYYKFFKRKFIVLMDRCLYDFLVGFELMEGKSRFIRTIYCKVPRADRIYLLDVSPETAFKRERTDPSQALLLDKLGFDRVMNIYKVTVKSYIKIARQLGIRIIDADDSIECVLKAVLSDEKLSQRAVL